MELSERCKKAAASGGELFNARYRNGSEEAILVRCLKVSEFQRYVELEGDEVATVELLASKPKGWGDTLDPESLYALLEVGEAINDPFFSRWIAQRKARSDRWKAMIPKSAG